MIERTALESGGWHERALRCPSPNFNARPPGLVPRLIVLHSISLPPGQFHGDAVYRLFTNTLDWDAHPYYGSIRGLQVSAHFFIRRNGQLLQFVSCNDRAWHAGKSSFQGQDNCNDFSIGIELEGLEGRHFTQKQYRRLAALCRALRRAYPKISAVAGHEHIAPGRKCDPGPGFDWLRLQHGLQWPKVWFPAPG